MAAGSIVLGRASVLFPLTIGTIFKFAAVPGISIMTAAEGTDNQPGKYVSIPGYGESAAVFDRTYLFKLFRCNVRLAVLWIITPAAAIFFIFEEAVYFVEGTICIPILFKQVCIYFSYRIAFEIVLECFFHDGSRSEIRYP